MKARSFFTQVILLVALTLGLVFSSQPAHAATTWVVNTLADETDGSCSDGSCSLRDAIALTASGDTVTFSVTGTILLSLGGLAVDKDLTINGPGAGSLSVDGSGAYQVFDIPTGVTVTLSGLMITHGNSSYDGGGISNYGTLALDRCTLADNVADNNGGGLNNEGTATVSRSTFSGNQATWGGGIKNEHGVLSVTNCTFTDNTVSSRGGGIDSGSNSTLVVTNSTFLGNSAYMGGGLGNPSSVSTAKNVLMAGNAGGDCNGAFAVGSAYNLTTDGTCSPGFTQVSPDQLALGDLTGNPAYFPLQFGSVAIDTGTNDGCPALDEPGNSRPLDGNGDSVAVCDVGAHEFSVVTFDHTVYLPLVIRN